MKFAAEASNIYPLLVFGNKPTPKTCQFITCQIQSLDNQVYFSPFYLFFEPFLFLFFSFILYILNISVLRIFEALLECFPLSQAFNLVLSYYSDAFCFVS